MKIPRKLRIDGEDWRVKKIKVNQNDLETRFFGMADHMERKITIDTVHRTDSTFLHEIVHAVDVNRHLSLTEEQVKSLSHGLYAVIKDNKLNFNE